MTTLLELLPEGGKLYGIIIALFTLVFIAATLFGMRKLKIDAQKICICGLSVAATIILSLFIRIPIGINDAAITLTSIPIIILSLVYGVPLGMLAGIVSAILSLFLVPAWAPIHPFQIPVEHYVCFVSIGIAGVFGCDKRYKTLVGVALAYVFKTLGHVFAGYLFFSEFAPEGMSPWGYTIIYNLTSKGIELVAILVIIYLLPIKAMKKVILKEN